MIDRIQWLGHGSFVIQGPPLIYINPWRVVRSAFHADVILVTHDHYEHCSFADIEKLRGDTTHVIANEKVAQQIPNVTVLRPWQSMTVDRASIKAVPAYSVSNLVHPREMGGLGFVISLDLFDIYYAGDTELIPEMSRIKPDIAILPIDGIGTLDVEGAAEVVKQMRPRWVIPSNWGAIGQSASVVDANRFRQMVGERAEVVLPQLIR
ncbi:MAG: MBL fold metallo-hydrolase [bacterium]|nr:MBL fold metallo-hydrolase [bacterium]